MQKFLSRFFGDMQVSVLRARVWKRRGIFPVILLLFSLNSLKFGIPPALVFQLHVYYKVDRLLTGQTAQQKGTTA